MHPRLELSSGSQRVHSYELLKRQIETKGLSADSFEFYLDAFRYGMPPHAGWGLGVERLLMSLHLCLWHYDITLQKEKTKKFIYRL